LCSKDSNASKHEMCVCGRDRCHIAQAQEKHHKDFVPPLLA